MRSVRMRRHMHESLRPVATYHRAAAIAKHA